MPEAATPKGDSPSEDAPMYSRTPGRDIFGKLDDRMPEVRVPAQVRFDAERKAHDDGLDLTTWLRELYYAAIYGPEHVASLYESRSRRVLGNAVQPRDSSQLPTFLRADKS